MHNNGGATQSLRFSFATPTTAFGFSYGAADTGPSTLAAYDIGGNLIASYSTPYDNISAGYVDYTGIAAPGIAYADLTLNAYNSSAFDYVLIDDFSYHAVTAAPEPASLVLPGTGLLGLVPMARRRARKN
ncbi:MAG: PEP-CTERM sorting domain-containing protein [bacterium]